jgi:hypothetical protein
MNKTWFVGFLLAWHILILSHRSGFLDIGVERIVDQVVNPKILTVFMPQVEDVVYKFLGIEKPKKGKENQNGMTSFLHFIHLHTDLLLCDCSGLAQEGSRRAGLYLVRKLLIIVRPL